jgi:hypothetical protein
LEQTLKLELNEEQRRMLAGWLIREKDHLLSIKAMAGDILVPIVTGTFDCIQENLDFVHRLRQAINQSEVVISDSDVGLLIEIAQSNRLPQFQAFWNGVSEALQTRGNV